MPFDGTMMPRPDATDIPAQGAVASSLPPATATPIPAPARPHPHAATQHSSLGFHPYLPDPAKPEKWVLGFDKPRFSLDSVYSYYPMFRLLGYVCDPLYTMIRKGINLSEVSEVKPKFNTIPDKISLTGLYKNANSASEVVQNTSESKKNTPLNVVEKFLTKKGVLVALNVAEAVAFTSLTRHYHKKELKDLHGNLDLAVSAERGLKDGVVKDDDLWQSKNPMIQSAMDRHKWQYRLRYATAPTFALGLQMGILANAFVITAERTAFYRPIALDVLKRALTEVQINNLDSGLTKEKLTDDLVKVLQQLRLDHRQPTIAHSQLHGIRPTLQLIAQDIIDKKIGFSGAIYVMGGGVIVPEDPQQTQRNYAHIREVGVSGVAKEACQIRETMHVGPAKLWEARIASQRNEAAQGEAPAKAASAKPDSLVRLRSELAGHGPVHGGAINAGRRGSSGLAV